MIRPRGSYRKFGEKALRMWVSTMTLYKKGPAIGGARFAQACLAKRQRPKNSHNRIITGIGTPSNQGKIPRPIISSMHSSPTKATETRFGERLPALEFQKA